ncbi:hypothetical protein [Sphingobium sp.]|uniref:hypothetical protein n=1 Tax=Sphingobium sp. TaxID=1912891 RepID=UPI002C7E1F67|nr:hypothetical protein [Sphingobium sp.]HUD90582.1 hypothetical protein [Sphingobium sp.]
MSACNIFPDDDRIEIWTDAAAYADDGEILALVEKVLVLSDISTAVAVQGDLRILTAMEALVPGEFDSFDGLAGSLSGVAEGIWEEVAGKAFLPTIIKAVGYSDERKRLEVWSVAVGETMHHPAGPARLLPNEQVSVSPCSIDLLSRLGRAGLMDGTDLRCDTKAERLAVMRAQRETAFPYEVAGGRAIRMVGGWAQRTVFLFNTLGSLHR